MKTDHIPMESNIAFQQFFNFFPIPLIITDKNFVISKVNHTFCDSYNFNSNDLHSKPFEILIGQTSKKTYDDFIKKIEAENNQTSIYINIENAESEFYVELNARIFSENFYYFTILDLTEGKNSAQRVKSSEKKIQSYIEASPTPIFIADNKAKYSYVNKAGCELVGYSLEELNSLSIPMLTFDDSTAESQKGWLELKRKGEIKNYLTKLKHKDGSPVDVLLDAVKISNDEFIAFCMDYTERKAIQEKLFNIQKSLEIRNRIAEELIKSDDNYFYQGILNILNDYYDFDSAFFGYIDSDYSFNIEFVNKKNKKTFKDIQNSKTLKSSDWKNNWGISLSNKQDLMCNNKIHYDEFGLSAEGTISCLLKDEKLLIGQITFFKKSGSYTTADFNELQQICEYISPLVQSNILRYFQNQQLIEAKRISEENEYKYRQLFENMVNGFALHKMHYNSEGLPVDYSFVSANSAFEKMTGLKVDEIIGKTLKQILPGSEDEKQKWINKYSEVVLQNKKIQFEDFSEALNKHYNVSAYSPLPEHFAVIIEDISERKLSNERVRENEEQLRSIYENSTVGIVLADKEGNLIYANNVFCDIIGYEFNETLKLHFKDFTLKKDLEKELEYFTRIIKGEINSYKIEKRYIKKDGSLVWVLCNIGVVKNSTGEVTNFTGVIENISDRKASEKAIIESQRLGAIGEMAAAVAHDFNNSLQAIQSNLELAEHYSQDEKVQKFISIAKSSSLDAASRVKHLQKFSGKGNAEKDHKPLNLNNLLDEVIQQTKPMWKNKSQKDGFEINVIVEFDDVLTINGNAGDLRSVFYNIIKNSVEAIPKIGNIKISAYKNNSRIEVLIEDDGVGMDESTKTRIFQPFFTTKGYELGRGLGMSSVYGIISDHKGDINIESDVKSGTKVKIIFPKIEIKNINTIVEENSINNPINVLWVDDEKMICENGVKLLEILNLNASCSGNAILALEALEKEKFDLVITDVGMPDMNGWQLAEKIREIYNDEIKIIIASGWNEDEQDPRYKKFNIDGIINKPFRADSLKKLISKVFDI